MATLKRHLENALTVKELIEELKNFDGKTRVLFAYNYGDYWKTEVANGVETADEENVGWSEYHRMPKVLGDNTDPEGEPVNVVVLRSK